MDKHNVSANGRSGILPFACCWMWIVRAVKGLAFCTNSPHNFNSTIKCQSDSENYDDDTDDIEDAIDIGIDFFYAHPLFHLALYTGTAIAALIFIFSVKNFIMNHCEEYESRTNYEQSGQNTGENNNSAKIITIDGKRYKAYSDD
ncbi:MAG: hypothetical protein GY858_01175 [Candidatus Omnitrophica bacterium]|nr:hypothetical protein [Candidatus Omnitrophota bacterium]